METTIKILISITILTFTHHINAQLVDNGDGTITDYAAHLMWLKDPLTSGPMTWTDAEAWVEALETAGYTDWRLPANRGNEVVALISYYPDLRYDEPFNNLFENEYIWSSSTHELSGEPYAILLVQLDINHIDPASEGYTWAVRDIPESETVEIDLWIKDWWKDRGSEPSSRSGQSWDIYIDNDLDGEIDLPHHYLSWEELFSFRNKIYVYVRNKSNAYVHAYVDFYVHGNQDELFSNIYKQGGRKGVYIHPNSRKLVRFDNNGMVNNSEIRLRTLYACTELNYCDILGAAVHHEFDPVTDFINNPPYDPQLDNNVASVSLNFLDENMAGKDASLSWKWRPWFGWFALVVVIGLALWSFERYFLRKYYRSYFSRNP